MTDNRENGIEDSINDIFDCYNTNDVLYNRTDVIDLNLKNFEYEDRNNNKTQGGDDINPNPESQSILGLMSFRNWLFGKSSTNTDHSHGGNVELAVPNADLSDSRNTSVEYFTRRGLKSIFRRNSVTNEECLDSSSSKQDRKYWKMLHSKFSRDKLRIGSTENIAGPRQTKSASSSKNIERLTLQLSDLSPISIRERNVLSYNGNLLCNSSSSSIERAVTIRKNLNEILFPASPVNDTEISSQPNKNMGGSILTNSSKQIFATENDKHEEELYLNVTNATSGSNFSESNSFHTVESRVDSKGFSKNNSNEMIKLNNLSINNNGSQDSSENKLQVMFPSVFKPAMTISNRSFETEDNSLDHLKKDIDFIFKNPEIIQEEEFEGSYSSEVSPSTPIEEAGPYKYIFPSPPFPTETHENIDNLLIDKNSIIFNILLQCFEELNLNCYITMLSCCSIKEVSEKILHGIVTMKMKLSEPNKTTIVDPPSKRKNDEQADNSNIGNYLTSDGGGLIGEDFPLTCIKENQISSTQFENLRNENILLQKNLEGLKSEKFQLEIKLENINKKYAEILKLKQLQTTSYKANINKKRMQSKRMKNNHLYESLRKYRYVSVKFISIFQKYLQDMALRFNIEDQSHCNMFLSSLLSAMKTNNLKFIEERALRNCVQEILMFISNVFEILFQQSSEFQHNELAVHFLMRELKNLRRVQNPININHRRLSDIPHSN